MKTSIFQWVGHDFLQRINQQLSRVKSLLWWEVIRKNWQGLLTLQCNWIAANSSLNCCRTTLKDSIWMVKDQSAPFKEKERSFCQGSGSNCKFENKGGHSLDAITWTVPFCFLLWNTSSSKAEQRTSPKAFLYSWLRYIMACNGLVMLAKGQPSHQ